MDQVTVDTVGDLATLIPSFQRHLRATNKSPKTVATYSEAANQLLAFLRESGMPTAVAKIGRESVESFIERLVATKSPATANNRYRALTALFNFLIDFGEITVSPMVKMKPPKVPDVLVPMLTDDQLRRLLATCEGKNKNLDDRRDSAILRLFIDTGLRLAELSNLKVSDINLDAKVANVMGKGARPRSCPFGDRTTRALDQYIHLRARSPKAAITDALWLGTRGAMGTPGIRSVVERRATQAGIGHLHAHMLRHGFAHQWLSDGGNETDLMRLVGWRSREMLQRYAASSADARAKLAYQSRPTPGDRL